MKEEQDIGDRGSAEGKDNIIDKARSKPGQGCFYVLPGSVPLIGMLSYADSNQARSRNAKARDKRRNGSDVACTCLDSITMIAFAISFSTSTFFAQYKTRTFLRISA